MKQNVTTGIVLKRINFGEADRIITVITPDYGKLRLMAKGVRRVKSKLAGGIELFSVSSITYIPGRRDISTLVSTRLDTHFGEIAKDINRTMLGYELLKLLNKTTEDECEDGFYELIKVMLEALNDRSISLDLVESWFYVRLLTLLGHSPNLEQDSRGNRLIANQSYDFDFESMAFFEREPGNFTDKHIKLLRLATRHKPEQIAKITDTEKLLKDCKALLRSLITASGHV